MDERPKTKLVPVGALWKGKGQVLLSGTVDLPNGDKLRVKMLKNKFKEEGDKKPDYRLFVDAPLDGEQGGFDGD